MQGMLQLPTEDPDLEGKAVKLNFQRKEVLPVPTEDPDLQEKVIQRTQNDQRTN